MIYKFSTKLYSKESLIKSAYTFIDDFYIHLDLKNDEYIVELTPKRNATSISMEEFKNEMLLQETRVIVNNRNQKIRDILFSRAMASTIIEEKIEEEVFEDIDADKILIDWFDTYE